jgi:hypothetical protein
MKPMFNKGGQQDSQLAQIRFWANVGGSGISPNILERTGFWSKSVVDQLRANGTDTSLPLEQIYGGVIKFKPLPGKEAEQQRMKIMYALNLDMQIPKHIQYAIDKIDKLLKQKWNDVNMSLLPEDLPPELKKMIYKKSIYIISEDPSITRQLLSIRSILTSLKDGYGYWSDLFAAANTMFGEMALYGANIALENMSIRSPSKQQQYISLDDMAEHVIDMVEG